MRNNVIWNAIDWYDTGIGIVNTRGAVVVHSTVVSDADHTNRFFSSLDYRFPLTRVEIQNNLVRRITRRGDARAVCWPISKTRQSDFSLMPLRRTSILP